MEIYLLHHGEPAAQSFDPYSVPLSELGRKQAQALAEQCQAWGIEFLCASTMARAEETADAITRLLPDIERWDLTDLEDINVDDLHGEPTASPLMANWTPQQRADAWRETWNRVTAALARIQVMAEARHYQRIAVLGHQSTLSLLVYRWLGLDWRTALETEIKFDFGATCRVTLGEKPSIDWINRT